MVEIGIMIEGQEDLTWDRLFRLAEAVESLGFAHLFRSDHLQPLEAAEPRAALALWPSLTALALRTRRLRFGPLVCPMTFRHPAMVAKMAAAVSALSGGRLDLGLGAGWYAAEHDAFGLDYPAYGRRLEMLDEGARLIRRLWSGEPGGIDGRHFRLGEGVVYPQPGAIPIIMGGKGRKTLQVVARLADEWNCSYTGLAAFQGLSARLDDSCLEIDRDPASLRRSLMVPFVVGRDSTAVQGRIDAHRAMFPSLPADLAAWRQAGFVGGPPDDVAAQLAQFAAAGVSRFMLQHNDLDDLASLELLATQVVPHFV